MNDIDQSHADDIGQEINERELNYYERPVHLHDDDNPADLRPVRLVEAGPDEPDDSALVGALLAQCGWLIDDLAKPENVVELIDADREQLAKTVHQLDHLLLILGTVRDEAARELAGLMEEPMELIGNFRVERSRHDRVEWDKDGAWRAARANIIDRWASMQPEKIELVDRVMTDLDVGFSVTPRVTGLKAIGVNGYEYRATTPATRWNLKIAEVRGA